MSNEDSKSLIRTVWIIVAAASSTVAVVAGNAANLFELKNAIGWWRVGLALAVVSLAAAVYVVVRQMDRRTREMKNELEAMKRKTAVEYLRTPDDVLERAAS